MFPVQRQLKPAIPHLRFTGIKGEWFSQKFQIDYSLNSWEDERREFNLKYNLKSENFILKYTFIFFFFPLSFGKYFGKLNGVYEIIAGVSLTGLISI